MDIRVRLASLSGPALVLGLSLIGSFVTSAAVASRAYLKRAAIDARQSSSITVKGSVRERIRADQAVWQIRVTGEAPSLQDAYATLERGVTRVQEFLRSCEFRSDEISLSAIDTSTFYVTDAKGHATREVSGYALGRNFVLTTPDVDRVARSAGGVTELIKEGVQVISYAPEYYYTRLSELRIRLNGAAAADARARADAIASAAGATVTEVRDAHMGVLQITRPLSTETASYGIYDTSTIEKDVTSVVTMTFGLSPAGAATAATAP
jgi:hypothetical protein